MLFYWLKFNQFVSSYGINLAFTVFSYLIHKVIHKSCGEKDLIKK